MNLDFMLMDEDQILEEVDEYLLYCFYLGFQPELRVRYRSPIRLPGNEDSNASWSMFTNTSRLNREYAWKDGGTGEYGDVFKLIQMILRCKNKATAVAQVRQDFLYGKGTELARQGISAPKDVDPSHIRIKSRGFDLEDLNWWKRFTGAGDTILRQFNVSRLKYYWLYDHQNTPTFVSDRGYAYRIYDHYQLYFPYRDKDRKFRHDFTEAHLPGFRQLLFQSDTLIITKSMKDVICLHTLGFEAVAPRSENTPIPDSFLEFLRTKYRYIFTLFDNDGKHRAWSYHCPSIEIPLYTKQKDPSDHHSMYGSPETKHLICSLLKNHPIMTDFSGIDWNKPMNRRELEELLEKTYLNKVITIQHVGRKIKSLCGKIHRIAIEYDHGEPICIIMLDNLRYEFDLGYFIQKCQIQQHGNTHTTD